MTAITVDFKCDLSKPEIEEELYALENSDTFLALAECSTPKAAATTKKRKVKAKDGNNSVF
jgi:hypothetical protein